MVTLFIILIIIAAVVLSLIVLVQNPKGGGLAGNIAGFSNQFMGVKQTTDVLEKGTWIFAAVIGVLCLVSTVFISGTSSRSGGATEKVGTSTTPTQQPTNQIPQTQPQSTSTPNSTSQKP